MFASCSKVIKTCLLSVSYWKSWLWYSLYLVNICEFNQVLRYGFKHGCQRRQPCMVLHVLLLNLQIGIWDF